MGDCFNLNASFQFLQYTIHFINECDIFIRKLQQQYQLKQLPINDSILFAAPVPIPTVATQTKNQAMNPPAVSGGRASARGRASQALTTGQQQTTTTMDVNHGNKRSANN